MNVVVDNVFTVNKSQHEISMESAIDMNTFGNKGTNFDDFYKVLSEL